MARESQFWRRLINRLRVRDPRFYPLFLGQAALCVQALDALLRLLQDPADPQGMVREIEALEKRADGIVQQVQIAVRRSVFPPYPRPAIVEFTNHLDDLLDLTEDAAEILLLYHVTRVTPEALKLAQLANDAARRLESAIGLLSDPLNSRDILSLCRQVHALEAEADHVLRAAMSTLFREETDLRELIKLRALYEVLERLTDVAKDIAARLSSLVLGHLGA
jgi:predicted phosphate transport protein (TIGR00153 family)